MYTFGAMPTSAEKPQKQTSLPVDVSKQYMYPGPQQVQRKVAVRVPGEALSCFVAGGAGRVLRWASSRVC